MMTNAIRSALVASTLALLSTAGLARAQQAAASTFSLVHSANSVVLAWTDGVLAGTARQHAVQFVRQRVLKGAIGTRFTLREPAGHTCGRALHGMTPGLYLLFLDVEQGRVRLEVSSSHSVVLADPELIAAIEAECASGRTQPDPAALCAHLSSPSARLRRDAAQALAVTPALGTVPPNARQQVADAVVSSIESDDLSFPSLLVTAERLGLQEVVPALTPLYLDGSAAHAERMLARALTTIDLPSAIGIIEERLPWADGAEQARALGVLANATSGRARASLEHLAVHGTDRSRISATAELLRRGVSDSWLHDRVPAEIVDRARATATRRPEFRSLRLNHRR